MHEVFISYSSKDQLTADTARAVLEQNGIRCWVAPRDVLPGMSWGGSIIDAINSARVMVLVFSDHANKSPQVEREIERAVNRSIPIIPMRIENVLPTKSLEYFISTPHWLDAFTPPLEKHLQRLTEIVRYNLAAQSGVSTEPEFGSSVVVEEAQGVRPGNQPPVAPRNRAALEDGARDQTAIFARAEVPARPKRVPLVSGWKALGRSLDFLGGRRAQSSRRVWTALIFIALIGSLASGAFWAIHLNVQPPERQIEAAQPSSAPTPLIRKDAGSLVKSPPGGTPLIGPSGGTSLVGPPGTK